MTGLCMFVHALVVASLLSVVQSQFGPTGSPFISYLPGGCWQPCLQNVSANPTKYKKIYGELVEAATDIKVLITDYNITHIVILIDTALSDRHIVPEVPGNGKLDSGTKIYEFQILLIMAIMILVDSPRYILIQFDEESAWTCETSICLPTTCASLAVLNQLNQIQMQPTSHCKGNIEAACTLGNKMVIGGPCASAKPGEKSMAIGFTNGNFRLFGLPGSSNEYDDEHICPPLKLDDRDFSNTEKFFSPCQSYFDTRYIFGTHDTSRDLLSKFHSKHGNYKYFHGDELSYEALLNFVSCSVKPGSQCCPSGASGGQVGGGFIYCKKTEGLFGESYSRLFMFPRQTFDQTPIIRL